MNEIQSGDRINNYIVEHLIGTGSFGQVWKAKHHVFDEFVAVKIPTDPQYVHHLRREGVAIHGLRHENIVRALDLDPYAAPPYLIMEYVDGPSLRTVIDSHTQGLPAAGSVIILRGILTALSAAHQAGLIHRDIKPANVLLGIGSGDLDGIQTQQVKVADFGLGSVGGLTTASIMQSGSLQTEAGRSISGTLAYMSPEQRDGRPVDQRSDLYACGVVLFEMLTGTKPQGNDLPSHVRSGSPHHLDEVFKRCYTRLDNRYRSAQEALAGLQGQGPPKSATRSIPSIPSLGRQPPCRNCGARVAPEQQFCINCGQQIVAEVPRCPSCQAFVLRADNYCIHCGTALAV